MAKLLSTAYFPPIAYMVKTIGAEEICIESWETYTKQTCRNHCKIGGPNGVQTLTIPVIKINGNHTLTRDIKISDSLPWQKTHWRSIETAYNNSPFFLYYQDLFSPFFQKKYNFLLDLNINILETIFKAIKQNTRVSISSQFNPLTNNDNRNDLVSKKIDFQHPVYQQPFSERNGFLNNLSIIDLIFNLGPESHPYLVNLTKI